MTAVPTTEVVPLSRMRRRIGRRMRASVVDKPQVTLHTTARAEALLAAARATGTGLTATLAAAVATTLTDHPQLNRLLVDDGFVEPGAVHLGIAADVPDGLVVVTLRDAAARPPTALAVDLADKAERARSGALTSADVVDATFTITGLGHLGVQAFSPIVDPPQVAILGVGAVRRAPVVQDDAVVPGDVVDLSLTFDHAAVDGAPAARFLQALTRRLEAR